MTSFGVAIAIISSLHYSEAKICLSMFRIYKTSLVNLDYE